MACNLVAQKMDWLNEPAPDGSCAWLCRPTQEGMELPDDIALSALLFNAAKHDLPSYLSLLKTDGALVMVG